MIHDLVSFSKSLELALCQTSELMQLLKPQFTLVGSIPEGTRIGIGNELDITIEFDGWRNNTPFAVGINMFNLCREDRLSPT